MPHTRSDVSRPLSWIAHRSIPLRVNFVLIMALVATQACIASDVIQSEGVHSVFIHAEDNCRVDNDKTLVRCDQLPHRLRAAHIRSDEWISLYIDNAKYETVVKTLKLFRKAGFTNVDVFPPFNGTNLSSKVKRWIRLEVAGLQNHIFSMLLISTERFETWREEVLVVSEARYDVIDRFAQARIAQPDCISFKDFRMGPRDDNAIAISTHREGQNRACVLPTAASCEFLSDLLDISDVSWTPMEVLPIKHVRRELRCDVPAVHDVAALPNQPATLDRLFEWIRTEQKAALKDPLRVTEPPDIDLRPLLGVSRRELLKSLGLPDFCAIPEDVTCTKSTRLGYLFYPHKPSPSTDTGNGYTDAKVTFSEGWALELYTVDDVVKKASWVKRE